MGWVIIRKNGEIDTVLINGVDLKDQYVKTSTNYTKFDKDDNPLPKNEHEIEDTTIRDLEYLAEAIKSKSNP